MAGTPEEKSRGAFFTPVSIAEHIAAWAVRTSSDRVLEPSCGEAVFLSAAGRAFCRKWPNESHEDRLFGVEIHAPSIARARTALAAEGLSATFRNADFFTLASDQLYDVILGNPPYIRYQDFSGLARVRSMEAALAQGVRLSGLASSWAAFVVTAASHLTDEGRLGLVLPAELLSVGYAAEVRHFLLNRFRSVKLIVFEERVFPGVLEDVVLLLAEGKGRADHFELHQTRNAGTLVHENAGWQRFAPEVGGKWTPALVASDAFAAYEKIVADECETLSSWGRTYLGSVTGNNAFFSVTAAECASLGLQESDLKRIAPPGSRHLRGLEFDDAAWASQIKEGAAGYLFTPGGAPSPGALAYIETGESRNVHKAYKCKVRSPWWRVPLVEVPDLLLTYMNHDRPRLIANKAKAHILNSIYGVKLLNDRRKIGMELLPLACLNSITLLGAEVVGRSYGGGLLKLEPREADRLPVPSLNTLMDKAEQLRFKKAQLSTLLRQGNLVAAARLIDPIVLPDVPQTTLESLRSAREILFQRRKARGRNA